MPLRNGRPLTFRPFGLSDAVDGTNTFPGAMSLLTNLVRAPTTKSMFIPRPAATQLTDFSTFTTPGVISAITVIGERVYGMIASGLNAGKDQPFIYDMNAGAFVSISGITAANTPTTQSSTGDWTPPCIAAITATKIIVCHPGFDGATHFFGTIDISTYASPAWSSGNTATNALPAIPKSVTQFNGRAYYAVNNKVALSDSLDPNTITNASQFLTLGDNQPVTVVAGLPLNNQLVGGQVQSVIAFKGSEVMYQITGDPATSNLALNEMNVITGTLAPNSIVPTPEGLMFVAPDGVRLINFQGVVSQPIGAHGDGVNVPFLNAISPTRMCADFNENTVRVSVQNGSISGQPNQEYWYDLNTKSWTGPHTFASALISSVHVGSNSFVTAQVGISAKLFVSRVIPLPNATYTENGSPLTWQFQTVLMPDNDQMEMNAIVQSAIGMMIPAGQSISIQATNEAGIPLGTASLSTPTVAPTTWGNFNWGAAVWGQASGYFRQYRLDWTQPLVFKQMQILVSGQSAASIAIGNLYLRYQILGYMLDVQTSIVTPTPGPSPGLVLLTEDGQQIETEAGQGIVTENAA